MLKRFAALLGLFALLVTGSPPVTQTAYGVGLITQSGPRLFGSSGGGGDDWQLDAGHYQTSIFALAQVYPRVQADRTTDGGGTIPVWAYHLIGPTVHAKVIRIGTRGGCPPWHYDISGTTLASATIDNDSTSQNYGALTIPAQTAGTYTISVRTQDQCAGDITKSWTYTVVSDDDTNRFVHLTAGAGGSETGTHGNPYRDLSDVVGPNLASTTNQSKQVIVSGTIDVAGVCSSAQCNSPFNWTLRLNANKPAVWMAASADAALIRGSSTTGGNGVNLGIEGGTDWVFAGINWSNPHQNLSGTFRNRLIALSDYGGLFDADVDLTTNSDSTDSQNSGFLFMSGNGDEGTATWDWMSIIGVNFSGGNQESPPYEIYDGKDFLMSMSSLTGSSNNQGFYTKGGNNLDRWAFYFNFGTGNTGLNLFTIDMIDMDENAAITRNDFEWMHNRFVSTGVCVLMKGAVPDLGRTTSMTSYLKRNNWKCANHYFQGSNVVTSGTLNVQYDAIEHSGTYTQGVQSATGGCGTSNTTCANNTHGTSGVLIDATAYQDAANGLTGREALYFWLIPLIRRRRRPVARRRRVALRRAA